MKKFLLSFIALVLIVPLYGDVCDNSNCGCKCFEIGADWLYWEEFQDNMEYGAIANETTATSSSVVASTSALSPNFQTQSGFRVYADYNFDNCWQFGAIFSHVYFNNRRNTNTPGPTSTTFANINALTFPIFSSFGDGAVSTGTQFASVYSSWSSNFNYLDLDISRRICTHPYLEITPHLGIRGMWIRQKLSIDGSGGLTTTAPYVGSFASNFSNNYDGYGLEGGLNIGWQLPCWNLSLVGHLGGSLLYARVKVEQFLTFILPLSPLTETFNVNNTVWRLSPTVDGFIGLCYEGYCCWPFELHLGWEQHIIIGANHFGTNYSSYTVQGLTLGGGVRF